MAISCGTDNVIAALGQSNRVHQVDLLFLADWQLEKVLAAMQVPFPEMTLLRPHPLILHPVRETPRVIADSFLGGTAPRLRSLTLNSISFPGLPKLLLSATQLVHLHLSNIPHSGYISPEAIVAPLSVLSSLEHLHLGFQSPQSRPDQESRSLPPPKRSILPILGTLIFKGVTEYLEELVTRIDTPQLNYMVITFFNQIDFDCPRPAQFINCTPTLRAHDEAHVRFDHSTVSVTLQYRPYENSFGNIWITISCTEPDRQLSSIEQVCNSSLHRLFTVEDLYIERGYWPVWRNDPIDNDLWLELLRPFTAVKNLYLSEEFAPGIAAALQEFVGGRITEVLPCLQNIFVKGLEPLEHFQESIGQFVAARQLSDYPIAISVWEKDSDMESM